jgi:predicted RND superfamily exporter protein
MNQFYPLFRQGCFIARHPYATILSSFLFAAVSCIGIVNFHWESNAIKLWLPVDSYFKNNYEHLWATYPPDIRIHGVVYEIEGGGDILQPKYFKEVVFAR